MNFQRNIRRKREEVFWSPVSRVFNLYRLSSAGELHGLELETPRNFKVTPYLLGAANREFEIQDSADLDGEWGVDAKFGVTPALNLDFTYNTDFAQVEVDAQQVNLTRFNLFFPEKRPFFLENAGSFQMGAPRSVELFFSRRIGLGPEGVVVPIRAGARLSGKAGSYNVGFLNMQTEELPGILHANNYTVASVSREFPNRSSLGALFVNRFGTGELAGDDNWNRTFGVDGKLGFGQDLTVTGFAAKTQTPNLEGSDQSYQGRAEFQNKDLRVWVGYTEVGENFNPEVGFLRRHNYRTVAMGVFRHLRPDIALFRELRPHVVYSSFWDFTGFKETEFLHFDSHFDFENGALIEPAVNHTVEGLKEPFEISPGVIVAPGTYKHWELGWRWNTNLAAPLSYQGALTKGGFLSGNRNCHRYDDQLPLWIEDHHGLHLVAQRCRPRRRQLRRQSGSVSYQLQLHAAHLPAGVCPVQRRHRHVVFERPVELAKHRRDGAVRDVQQQPRARRHTHGPPEPKLYRQLHSQFNVLN